MSLCVLISDIQYPYHHRRAVSNLLEFVKWVRPDSLACVGDELDAPEPSKWSKGLAGEYESTLQKSLDGCRDLMEAFREAAGPDAPFDVMRSNHTDRVAMYVKRFAPALSGLRSLEIESLLGYDEQGIVYHHRPYELAPGLLLMHGDEAGYSTVPGRTALNLAKKTGMSVVIGHTHSQCQVSSSVGFNGRLKTIVATETGHLMDVRKAHYLKTGSGDWQMGFSLLEQDGRRWRVTNVPMFPDGSFLWDGKVFS